MHIPAPRSRRGFTMLEMLISMSLMLAIFGLSTRLFRTQTNAVSTQAGRLDAQQNSRFALSNLDRQLRMAGVGVVDAQPLLVQAGALAITFNGNLVSLDTGDLGAVYINPDADSAGVDVLRTNEKITLPGTSKLYPDSTYMQNSGVPGNAETISYWLSQDSTSTHTNEYVLFRRVNARPPKVVARGLLYNPGDTIFQYFKPDSLGALVPVSTALLPVIHTAPVHGSQADTGKSALSDSIRQVKVQLTSIYHDPRTGKDTYRKLSATIHLMNAGLIHHTTCGNAPIAVTPTATFTAASPPGVPQPFVTITWAASGDEFAAEKDVERYAIYRRLSSVSTFDEPLASVPAGTSTYTFKDTDLITGSGQIWIYGVAAQDCTPQSSSIGSTLPVVIP